VKHPAQELAHHDRLMQAIAKLPQMHRLSSKYFAPEEMDSNIARLVAALVARSPAPP